MSLVPNIILFDDYHSIEQNKNSAKMACLELRPTNCDSEMEEGEIIDEVDELSDISSEEEFLLRQRLQVLENYNNVLERKQAKRRSNGQTNSKRPRKEVNLCDLSEVSETEFEENNIRVSQKFLKRGQTVKHHKRKKAKEPPILLTKIKDSKKRTKQNKKKISNNLHIKSSDDSDDEYFNKRRKLADAVTLKKNKSETSLKDRINRMLFGAKKPSNIMELNNSNTLAVKLGIHDIIKNVNIVNGDHYNVNQSKPQIIKQNCDTLQIDNFNISRNKTDHVKLDEKVNAQEANVSKEISMITLKESINLCSDNESSQDAVDSPLNEKDDNNMKVIDEKKSEASSDEDLEMLREYALKTKCSKFKIEKPNEKITIAPVNKPPTVSDDEDSDTAELRLICLKSTLLKKAIEMKQKQKLKKRLSQSSTLQEDFMLHKDVMNIQSENNTDIESVDMDIGSDGEEKAKENSSAITFDPYSNDNMNKHGSLNHQEDELEEDEDLLRAKLLTSLTKNLPNLVHLGVLNSINEEMKGVTKDNVTSVSVPVPEEKKFIIKLGESDSEGEHEATKNLTKMHLKLAEHYQDFQSKLDSLLKSTRMEFEKDTLPDVVQNPTIQKSTEKFVPKAMNHLPKSEQIEYKNLVRRMAELEKIKQARNSLILSQNKTSMKETLKPRNISLNNSQSNLDEKIAMSRKKIAEESAKVLKLKEEAKKLSQKYKIVATELKNISTAINFNKKQQRAVHNNLQQIRLNHQLLLKGSTLTLNSVNSSNRMPFVNKIQKENNPKSEESYANLLKSVKVSFVNDVNRDISAAKSRLSVQLDVANNKKTIKLPKSPPKGRVVDIVPKTDIKTLPKKTETEMNISLSPVQTVTEICTEEVHVKQTIENSVIANVDDYKSPLAALKNTTWEADPNAFLCPYEVGGSCRDPDCKYLHPKVPPQQ